MKRKKNRQYSIRKYSEYKNSLKGKTRLTHSPVYEILTVLTGNVAIHKHARVKKRKEKKNPRQK